MSKERVTAAMAGEYLGRIRSVAIMIDGLAISGAVGRLVGQTIAMSERVALALIDVVAERDALERRQTLPSTEVE